MTRLESTLESLQTARNAQAAVDTHMAAERHRADLETRYLEALTAYLAALEALGRHAWVSGAGCRCSRHKALQSAVKTYRAAWSDWRGRDV